MNFKKSCKNHWNFITTEIFLLFKKLTEYKTNFYSSLIVEIIYYPIQIYFFYILTNNFKFLNWSFQEFIYYSILISITDALAGIFVWRNYLSEYIKQGYFNNLLTKPKNVFILYLLNLLSPIALILLIIDIIVLTIFIIIYHIKIYNQLLSLFFLITITISRILNDYFIDALGFIYLDINKILGNISRPISNSIANFSPLVFKKFQYKIILNIFSFYFIGTILIPIITNKITEHLKTQIIILLCLILFVSVSLIIIWHYGLNKYEAYS